MANKDINSIHVVKNVFYEPKIKTQQWNNKYTKALQFYM